MIRRNITISPNQDDWLRAESEEQGISVSELLRKLIDREREGK